MSYAVIAAASTTKMKEVFNKMGLTPEAQKLMVHQQAIKSIQVIGRLDDDEIENLARVCRKPGGSVDVPGARPGDPVTKKSNYGIPLAADHETNLKLLAFGIRYKFNTFRSIKYADLDMVYVESLRSFRKEVLTHTNTDAATAPSFNANQIFGFFESIEEWLHDQLGKVSKIPLSYIIRKDETVKDSADDPAFGSQDSEFLDRMSELRARAPHFKTKAGDMTTEHTDNFIQDNARVFSIVWDLFRDTLYAPYVKPFQRTRNGRAAYHAVYHACLGTEAINNYAQQNEDKLNGLTYDGKRKNWTLTKFLTAHVACHGITLKLTEYGCGDLSEQQKISKLHQGMLALEMQTCKSAIIATNPATFKDAAQQYSNYEQQAKLQIKPGRQVHVAAVDTRSSGRRNGRGRPAKVDKIGPEDDQYDSTLDYSHGKCAQRYYVATEWNALTKANRNWLRGNGHAKKGKRKSVEYKSKSKSAQESYTQKAQIAALQADMKRMQTSATAADSSATESESDSDRSSKKQKKTVRRKNR